MIRHPVHQDVLEAAQLLCPYERLSFLSKGKSDGQPCAKVFFVPKMVVSKCISKPGTFRFLVSIRKRSVHVDVLRLVKKAASGT